MRAAPSSPRYRQALQHGALPSAGVWLVLCALSWAGCRDLQPDPGFCAGCLPPGREGSYTAADASLDTSTRAVSEQPAKADAAIAADSGQASAAAQAGMTAAARAGASSIDSSLPTGATSAGRNAAGGSGVTKVPLAGASPAPAGSGPEPDAGRDSGAPVDATVPPPEPCNGACSGDKPVCDERASECVQCTRNDQNACGGVRRACDFEAQTCVMCTRNDDGACREAGQICDATKQECVVCLLSQPDSCPGDRPVCDEANQRCVQCTADRAAVCARLPERSHCQPERQACVECLGPQHCPALAKSRCDEEFVCNGCASDADCERFFDTPACDAASHTCVPCTGTRTDRCASRECLPNNMCAPPRPTTATLCAACTEDSMCPERSYCALPSQFCLPEADREARCDTRSLYRTPLMTVDRFGRERRVCAPASPLTCGMIQATLKSQPCSSAAECAGGVCSSGVCTYTCANLPCPQGFRCQPDSMLCVRGQ